jgi:hypothetical protein
MEFQIVLISVSLKPLALPRSNVSNRMLVSFSGWFNRRPKAQSCNVVLRCPSGIGVKSGRPLRVVAGWVRRLSSVG